MPEPSVILPEDPEGETPAAPAAQVPAEAAGISPEEFAELKSELQQARGSINDLRAGYQQEHAERARLEAGMQSVVQMRQQEQQAAAQAAAMQEPDIAWDKFEDPDLMKATLNTHGQTIVGRILHAMQPYAEAARTADRNNALVQSSSTALALRQTREDWTERGYSEDTWGKIEGDLRDYLKGDPEALAAALTPGGGTTQAFHFANQRNLQIQDAAKEEPPIQLGASERAGDGVMIDAELSPVIEQMKKTLGFDSDWQPSEAELEEIKEAAGLMGR